VPKGQGIFYKIFFEVPFLKHWGLFVVKLVRSQPDRQI